MAPPTSGSPAPTASTGRAPSWTDPSTPGTGGAGWLGPGDGGGQRVAGKAQGQIRIATKYPRTTKAYLQRRGLTAEVIKLSGAIELGPLTGLCERIIDITQTGETLRQNGLVEVDTVGEVSSRLVVNPARLKLDGDRLGALIDALERAVHG